MLIVVGELLGTFGQFRRAPVAIACSMIGASAIALRLRRNAIDVLPPPPSPGPLAMLLSLGVSGLLTAQWSVRAFGVLARGFNEYDTLHYHLPMAARFVQSGWTSRLHFVNPEFPNVFHPLNSELLHSFGMLWFGRDIISPLLNVGWMGLTLLAAWCIGRPWGLGPSAVVGVSVLLTQPLAIGQSGSALSDVAGVALVVAAAGLVVQPERGRAGTVVAAAAGGLALGSKLPFIAPVAGLTIGIVVIAPRAMRWLTARDWSLPLAVTGSYWYLRNFVRVGSPIPSLRIGIGSFSLPRARFEGLDRLGFSVAHYLGSGTVWRDWFLPGLDRAFGPLWWFSLALAGTGMIWALAADGRPVIRMLGAVAIVSTIAYLLTPGGALGPEGQPFIFVSALRYWMPALALGLILLPLVPALRTTSRQAVLLTAFTVAIAGAQTSRDFPAWAGSHYREAIFVGLVVTALGGMLLAFRRGIVSPRTVAVVLVVVAELALAAGYAAQRGYLRNRFAGVPLAVLGDGLHEVRIGLAGSRGYPLSGEDLSNHVQYVGTRGAHGEFHGVRRCAEWQRLIRDGRYSLLVLEPDYRPVPGHPQVLSRELPWTRLDPGAREIGRVGPAVVFRFDPSVPPSGCSPEPA